MRIAALIQAHKNPPLLGRLLDALSGDLWQPYLHLDAKSDAAAFAGVAARVRRTERRVDVRWGEFSQVEATLVLLRTALADESITHFYLMSGQCYPLRPDEVIRRRLESLGPGRQNLIAVRPMPEPSKPLARLHWHTRLRGPERLRRVINGVAARFGPPRASRRLIDMGVLHAGSSWWLLDRDTVAAMLGLLDANPWYLDAMSRALCADEMFFQTLFVMLGRRAGGPQPTAAKWIEGRANPEIVDAAILTEMLSGPALFGRKFDAASPLPDLTGALP